MFALIVPFCVLENKPGIYRYKFRGMQPSVEGIRGISAGAALPLWCLEVVIELSR